MSFPEHEPHALASRSQPPQVPSHFRDDFRTAVFSGDEEALLRLAAHLQSCPDCQVRQLVLVERLSATALSPEVLEATACGPVRSSLLRFLEQDRELTVAVLQHLLTCDECRVQLTDAAHSAFTNEVHGDEERPAL